MLKIGDKAPAFRLKNDAGNDVSLSVDGVPLRGGVVPVAPSGAVVRVEARVGS